MTLQFAEPDNIARSLGRSPFPPACAIDEPDAVRALLNRLSDWAPDAATEALAVELAHAVRRAGRHAGMIDAVMRHYPLSRPEGVLLMRLAEAFDRVPDGFTRDALIRDKLGAGDWFGQMERQAGFAANLASLGLGAAKCLLAGYTRPLLAAFIRRATGAGLGLMARHFVMGADIETALKRSAKKTGDGTKFSFDILGEAALTAGDARRYFNAYLNAITRIGDSANGTVFSNPGISIKLSALHPRYEAGQTARVMAELVPDVATLCRASADRQIALTIDAEESHRLDLSLDILEVVSARPELADWQGLGCVVQAYHLRAPQVIDRLAAIARRDKRRLMVRLVKGAYWDQEIKRAQELGLDHFPVFTRKAHTDVSYLACMTQLFGDTERFYPQLATHNAHSAAYALSRFGNKEFEFQRLFGMGEGLHDALLKTHDKPVRVYAPVGAHKELLPYLVRRLLENGANSSFVNQIGDDRVALAEIVRDPVADARLTRGRPAEYIALPRDMFGTERRNAAGGDVDHVHGLAALCAALKPFETVTWRARPVIGGRPVAGRRAKRVRAPHDPPTTVGMVEDARIGQIGEAVRRAQATQARWRAKGPKARAEVLRCAGDLLEDNMAELIALCVREAGKTLADGLADVREAIDFCRYYAAETERCGHEVDGDEPSVFACISPWNFPVAIFTGQICGALAVGNAVIAKPAEQTPLAAGFVVSLLHRAGVPGDVLAFLPGEGGQIGARLVAHPGITGVCFTGSLEVAQLINRTLADNDAVTPLIAETGGLNAAIVDATALPEQAVKDVVSSAFQSAGQRCSALRLLYLQEDIAVRFLEALEGAMAELRLGDPADPATDVGPVIDAEAQAPIERHIAHWRAHSAVLCEAPGPTKGARGHYVRPCVIKLESGRDLTREIFGPVLHVVTFKAAEMDRVVDEINGLGYGLTLGVHSRIDQRTERIAARARIGNIYVNRNQIGAVVGVQPFGGEGLSGTGPKAGGPHYLARCADRPVAVRVASGRNGSAPEHVTAPGDLFATLHELSDEAARIARVKTVAGRIARPQGRAMADYATAYENDYVDDQVLPGPDGEHNRLMLHPRGRVLIGAFTQSALALVPLQIAAALLTGNQIGVIADETGTGQIRQMVDQFAEAGGPAGVIQVAVGTPDGFAGLCAEAEIDAVALAGDEKCLGQVARVLARRDGPIVPLIIGTAGGKNPAGPLYRFATERTVTVNMAAAGGDAALLSQG
jgi:RHH-type proline utilization regulon transcriptional repressor/proline dehydrogenase/delta 1-pyrroline-5-carboxylate dehydrogenase